MTDIELEYPYEDAVEFVKAAMERTPGVTSYEVDSGGETLVGRAQGGITGRGEKVFVHVSDSQADTTTITVRAEQSTGYAFTANPWKYKSEFVEAVYELRGRPVEDVVRTVGYEQTEATTDEMSSATATAWLLTAKVLLVPLLLLGGLILVFAMF